MSRRLLICTFEHEDDVVNATEAARANGYKIVDVYAPFAVHGLDKVMGLQPSRLPLLCFFLGLFGAALKVWFEFWTTAQDWPVNVGGKPWNSLPAFVPVTFEVMVLFAGVSTVLAFFFVARLRPWRKAVMPHPGVTDDRFALVLEEDSAAFDVRKVRDLLARFHAADAQERVEEGQ